MNTVINILYYLHSINRWLVAVAIVAALGYALYGLATGREYDSTARRVMSAFSSLVGLQWLLGILYYGAYGSYLDDFSISYQISHATYMTIALVVAHLYLPFRKRDARTYYIASTVVIIVTIIVVWLGVTVLPQNWPLGFNAPVA